MTECSNKELLDKTLFLISENESYFAVDESEAGQRLGAGLLAMRDGLQRMTEHSTAIKKVAGQFDFLENVPGNGFRSLCVICNAALCSVNALNTKLSATRSNIMFRKTHFVREVEAWTQALGALCRLLSYTVENIIPQCCEEGSDLIPCSSVTPEHQTPMHLINTLNSVPLHAFYGRCVGFHYVSSLQKTFQLLTLSLSAFSQAYYSDGSVWWRTKQSIVTSGQYLLSPEQRARRIVAVLQYADVDFIKSFWDLAETEVMRQLPSLVCPRLAVCQAVAVPVCEEVRLPSLRVPDTMVTVPPPCSHALSRDSVTCHLLSSVWRKGMLGCESARASAVQEPSDVLIVHFHGGGFVTQSTKSQEMFLREWCSSTGAPMFSVDYSLAPEAPYPRPLEEALHAYGWALSHLELLGSTGRRVILTGDSAGGSLSVGVTLRCLQLGIRPPDGLFLAYTPFTFRMVPSPAKLLAVLDPMLPLSFVLRCLKAYAGYCTNDCPEPASHIYDCIGNSECDTRGAGAQSDLADASLELSVRPQVNVQSSTDGGELCRIAPVSSSSLDECGSGSLMQEVELGEEEEMTGLNTSKLCLLSPSVFSEADSDTLTTVSLNSEISKVHAKKDSVDATGVSEAENNCGSCDIAQEPLCEATENEGMRSAESVSSKEERSRKYVAEFLKKYVVDTEIDKEGRKVPVLRTEESVDTDSGTDSSGPSYYYRTAEAATRALSGRLGAAKDAVIGGITTGLSSVGLVKPSVDECLGSTAMTSPSPDAGIESKFSCDDVLTGDGDPLPTLLEEFEGVSIVDDPFLNTLEAPHALLELFPPTCILTLEFDFCLDDCVMMARLLRSLGVQVTLDVLKGLPHGFLNLTHFTQETRDGCATAIKRIKQLLSGDFSE